ncbi:hypothetical protein ACP4OV_011718 [Aristida adscensionis]
MAESLEPYGHVDNFLIAAYCQSMLLFQPIAEMPLVKKAFEGACLARKMHLCHLLYFSIYDDYQIYVSGVLVEAFKELWCRFNSNNPLPFEDYRVVYPATPKQQNLVCLPNLLSHEDIPNIRINLLNDIFFSPLNQADKSLVYSFYNEISNEAAARRATKFVHIPYRYGSTTVHLFGTYNTCKYIPPHLCAITTEKPAK